MWLWLLCSFNASDEEVPPRRLFGCVALRERAGPRRHFVHRGGGGWYQYGAPHADDGRFCLIDYLPLARELCDTVMNEKGANAPRIVPLLKAFVDASRSDSLQGDIVLAKLYTALDSCGLTRTSTQRVFHQQFVHSILPWIYGKKDFARYKERVLHESGIHPDKYTYNQYTLISTRTKFLLSQLRPAARFKLAFPMNDDMT